MNDESDRRGVEGGEPMDDEATAIESPKQYRTRTNRCPPGHRGNEKRTCIDMKERRKKRRWEKQQRAKERRAKGAVMSTTIYAHGSVIAMLDDVAEALERRGHRDLAGRVDGAANDLLEQRDDMLDWTGFDDVMKRTDDVADRIYDERIEPLDTTDLLSERP